MPGVMAEGWDSENFGSFLVVSRKYALVSMKQIKSLQSPVICQNWNKSTIRGVNPFFSLLNQKPCCIESRTKAHQVVREELKTAETTKANIAE